MLNLPEVTICAVSSVALSETELALQTSMEDIAFGAAKLFTHDFSKRGASDIEFVEIPPIRSRSDYSRFVLKELAHHIRTDFVLLVQWDGFVLRPHAWRHEFLNFDYIGATWPQFSDGWNVGNGGFSLRSRKLLDVCAANCPLSNEAEDIAICRTSRRYFEEQHGIRFASNSLASAFSYERTPTQGIEFGFHGIFNMIDVLGKHAFAEFYRMLPKAVIGRKEHRDLLSLALAGGQEDLARQIIRYHLSRPSLVGRGVRFLISRMIHDLRPARD